MLFKKKENTRNKKKEDLHEEISVIKMRVDYLVEDNALLKGILDNLIDYAILHGNNIIRSNNNYIKGDKKEIKEKGYVFSHVLPNCAQVWIKQKECECKNGKA